MILTALLVLVPFLAAATGLAAGRRIAAPVAVGGAALALVVAVALAARVLGGHAVDAAGRTIDTGGPALTVSLLADHVSVVLALTVTVVALLVQVFSIGYLHGDPRYPSYAAVVSLFTAAMLLVVVAGDLLVLFVGWEVMGLCSYLLIGHHWEQRTARSAAVKAFLTTRIGDVLLLFGIIVLGSRAGSFRIADVLAVQPSTVALLLVLGGAVGKSAQFPLHVWLPDAMAGPTPVSALIHAATMVAAGVFLVVRLWPLYAGDDTALGVLAVLATLTMVGAALAALAQDDLKRVLAYSTASQLAYMFAAISVHAPTAAVFHLVTHAAFKALLFLAAGSVMHALGTSLLRDMGGLRRAMPVTCAAMTVGFLALAGVPPLAGFWSKESVLAAAEEQALHGATPWTGWLVLVGGLLTVVLTAAYATRAWLLTFGGERRGSMAVAEAGRLLTVPLLVLAGLTVVLGVLALPDLRDRWYGGAHTADEVAGLGPGIWTTLASLLAVLLGAGAAVVAARRGDPALALGPLRRPLAAGFGVDALYDRVVVRPIRVAARVVALADERVLHGAVRAVGRGGDRAGVAVRATQGGRLPGYLTVMVAGAVVLAVAGAVAG